MSSFRINFLLSAGRSPFENPDSKSFKEIVKFMMKFAPSEFEESHTDNPPTFKFALEELHDLPEFQS